jgi:hypothetical protein
MHAGLDVSVPYCCPAVKKMLEHASQQILIKLPNIKFHESPFSSSQAITHEQTRQR